MGANGSKARGDLEDVSKRQYHTEHEISANIKVIEANQKNAMVKLPEESHTPNRVYVAINKPATEGKWKNDPYAGKYSLSPMGERASCKSWHREKFS